MKLILDYKKRKEDRILLNLLDEIPYGQITEIKASVAYNQLTETFKKIIEKAKEKNIKITWWGLLDENEATGIKFLEEVLNPENTLTFYWIKNEFHSKLLHFVGYGVYIGSANMTRSALENNIETGVFYKEDELKINNNELFNQIDDYFKFLNDHHKNILTQELYKEYKEKIEEYKSKDKQINNERKIAINELLERHKEDIHKLKILNSKKEILNAIEKGLNIILKEIEENTDNIRRFPDINKEESNDWYCDYQLKRMDTYFKDIKRQIYKYSIWFNENAILYDLSFNPRGQKKEVLDKMDEIWKIINKGVKRKTSTTEVPRNTDQISVFIPKVHTLEKFSENSIINAVKEIVIDVKKITDKCLNIIDEKK